MGRLTLRELPFFINGERWPLGRAPLPGAPQETLQRLELVGTGDFIITLSDERREYMASKPSFINCYRISGPTGYGLRLDSKAAAVCRRGIVLSGAAAEEHA
jgi:hypothetical protein